MILFWIFECVPDFHGDQLKLSRNVETRRYKNTVDAIEYSRCTVATCLEANPQRKFQMV